MAYGYNPKGGTRNYHFSTYHDVSELEEAIRLVRGYRPRYSGYFFRAENFFNVATVTKLQYNNDGRLPDYHAQSHGENFLSFLQDEARARSTRRRAIFLPVATPSMTGDNQQSHRVFASK